MLSKQDKLILAYFEAFDRFLETGLDNSPLREMKRLRGQLLKDVRKRQEEEARKIQKTLF